MADTVTAGTVVSIHYTLRNPDGDVLDTSDGREPLAYLHGYNNIVPGLERGLEGRQVGDQLDVIVKPEEGYGVRNDEAVMVLPRDAFPEGMPLEPGTPFAMQNPNNPAQTVHCFIVSVRDAEVLVDANHPLAGVELRFAVEIVSLRDATGEEKAQGHPGGPGGPGH
ncbi:MAG: peptidylprolyl isomerase [Myxococcota bacterium]